MSQIDCNSCDSLRDSAAAFVANGVTTTVCTSLKNNTGLGKKNDNCTDLNDANDCLVGRMAQDVEAYEVCDWKVFIKKFITNVYEIIKAIICWLCGIQNNVDDLWDRASELCEKIDMATNPILQNYGVVPYHPDQSHNVGTIGTKNGNPLITVYEEQYIPDFGRPYAGVGIQYARKQFSRCSDGACQKWEWFAPAFYLCDISGDAEDGDILWYVEKSAIQNACGISETFWEAYTTSSWTWKDVALQTDHRNAWIEMTIDPDRMGANYLTLVYRGSSYPNGAVGTTQGIRDSGSTNTRTAISSCN